MGVVGHGPNRGETRTRGPETLSQDSIEAVFRRAGVEVSPLEKAEQSSRHSAPLGVLQEALRKAGLTE